MALFQPFRGSRAVLDTYEKCDGHAYFCTDDGSLHIDYMDADGNLQRKQINAKDCETITGLSLEELKEDVIPNMKRIDEAGLERGWYDAAALEKFQNDFNRVYVELSRNRGIYGKVALTSSGKFGAQPVDYDIDDQEIPYYLGSIPTRLNGSEKDPDFNDTDTRYRVGHIKVPAIDVDNFPIVDEANEFAMSKLYVDTAIDRSIEKNNKKENIYYTSDIDNHGITVTRDGKVDDKTTELYINNNYKIDSTVSNYFKFTTNFKWNCTNNSGELYFCIRDSVGLKGYIYLMPSANTIRTNGNINTNLNLSSVLPQNEWVKLSIFGELGGMSYLKINDTIYELNNKAFTVPNANDIICFTISLSKSFEGTASISEVGYILDTDAAINSAEYKVDKIDISGYVPNSAVPKDKTNPIYSPNTNYVWTTTIRDDNDNVVVNKKFVMDTLSQVDIPNNPVVSVSPLAGKKIAYHGDSICESRTGTNANNGGGYAKIIADITGSTYDNRAGSGSVFVSAIPEGQTLSNTAKCIVTDMDNMPDDADIICFQGGINDWFKGCPLGKISAENDYSDPLDTTTVVGALESICRKAINKWPGKPICFVITHKIANSNSAYAKCGGTDPWSYKELHDVMIQIYNKYSIPYLDMFNEGGLNSYMNIHNIRYFTGGSSGMPDQTHPNEAAYKKYYVPQLIKLFESLAHDEDEEVGLVPITATIEGVYTAYTQKRPDEYVSSDYVTVEFYTDIRTQDDSELGISVTVSSDYPYDSLVITNGASEDDLEYIEVPLLLTGVDGSRFYDETLRYDYTAGGHVYDWNDIYGCKNEIANFIYNQLPWGELNTNVASQLTFASGIITEDTGLGDLTCTVTLEGFAETTKNIELVDTNTNKYIVGSTGGAMILSETYTEPNAEIVSPMCFIKDNPSVFSNDLLRFVATNIVVDDFDTNSFTTITQFGVL